MHFIHWSKGERPQAVSTSLYEECIIPKFATPAGVTIQLMSRPQLYYKLLKLVFPKNSKSAECDRVASFLKAFLVAKQVLAACNTQLSGKSIEAYRG